MPSHHFPEKKRIILEFGTGDIHISCAKLKGTGAELVIFHPTEPRPIGSTAPELHGTECDDFSVGMSFSKSESIDAVIDVLREYQAEKWPKDAQAS